MAKLGIFGAEGIGSDEVQTMFDDAGGKHDLAAMLAGTVEIDEVLEKTSPQAFEITAQLKPGSTADEVRTALAGLFNWYFDENPVTVEGMIDCANRLRRNPERVTSMQMTASCAALTAVL